MDPITLAIIPLTLLATKATETVGEKLGEGVVAAGQMFLAALWKQSPETVKRLEAASDPNVIDVGRFSNSRANNLRVCSYG